MPKPSTGGQRSKGGKASDGNDNGNENGKGGGTLTIPEFYVPTLEGEKQRNYTSLLVIRCSAEDFGGRPLPPGTVFWESPDVWVESSLGKNQPVVGQANTVFAQVNNFGLAQANGVVVKFYWANPSLAITEASAHLIGIATDHINIPKKNCVIVECPKAWVPVEENGGHECLLAEAYIPVHDELTAPMDPVLDHRVGQKNEQLVTVPPGGEFRFTLHAANVAPLRQTVAFDVQSVTAQTLPRVFEQRTELRREILEAPSSQLPLTLRLGPPTGTYVAPSDLFARGLLAQSSAQMAGQGACVPFPWISHSAELEPWESRLIEVSGEVPQGTPIGQTYMFRVIQRIGPVITGGYTVAVLVA